MEPGKTKESLKMIDNIQESLKNNETVLTTEESTRIENSLTNIKVAFSKITNLENEVSENIMTIKNTLNDAQTRI